MEPRDGSLLLSSKHLKSSVRVLLSALAFLHASFPKKEIPCIGFYLNHVRGFPLGEHTEELWFLNVEALQGFTETH